MTKSLVREPRWPAFIAMMAASGVYIALPEPMSVGPSWGLLGITIMLIIPTAVSHQRGRYDVARILSFTSNIIITVAMIVSLVILIRGIPDHAETPKALLRSAIALWIANVLVFALWYWKLDAGGPMGRDKKSDGLNSSFLFPQMLEHVGNDPNWTPQFMDYLFLAFNTSTAFSPTDTAVLSRWAKLGMMLQSLISLSIVILLRPAGENS